MDCPTTATPPSPHVLIMRKHDTMSTTTAPLDPAHSEANSQRGVVVTGGASGIGRATAEACIARGDRVVLFDLDGATTAAVSAEIGAVGGFACDVADPDAVAAAASLSQELLGTIHLVVHAAGVVGPPKSAVRSAIADQRWVIDVNVIGTMAVGGSFGSLLVDQDVAGHLVFFGSEHSLGVPHLGIAAYTASKHAVLGYADVLRRELPEHVGVSVVCPGIVATTLWRSSERRQQAYGGAKQAPTNGGDLMERGMAPEHVAQAILRGVAADEFLIVTHGHVLALAEERGDIVRDAFARQMPDGDDGRYEIARMIATATGGSDQSA